MALFLEDFAEASDAIVKKGSDSILNWNWKLKYTHKIKYKTQLV